ncbi:hypothetical protein BMT63_19180 [Escherichia coli]|nr:hypothetical protein BMT63_19180 [Escherichia coli]
MLIQAKFVNPTAVRFHKAPVKGTIHSLLGQTNQVAGMCKSMMMLIRRLDWPPESPDNQYHLFK